jgi:hypothetical protein
VGRKDVDRSSSVFNVVNDGDMNDYQCFQHSMLPNIVQRASSIQSANRFSETIKSRATDHNPLETIEEEQDDPDKGVDHFKSYILAWLSMILYSFAHIVLAQQGNEKGIKSVLPQSIAMIMIAVTQYVYKFI